MSVALETDNTTNDPFRRAPLVTGGEDLVSVTETVCRVVERPTAPPSWYLAFAITSGMTFVFALLIAYLIATGVGVWGNNSPVFWAFDITNFVFWIGIGHAGTLISAILFLFRQKWRTAINRSAEAMTIFAVTCAGLFPAIHVGRVWFVYWLAPYPNQMSVWPNFRSPLLWDVFAVSTYATVSALFWYLGMIPDLATLRDRATQPLRQVAYGAFALGWRGLGPAVARLRAGVPDPGRPGHAVGAERPLGRQHRLCRGPVARLAFDDFSALFRGRGHLQRLRHGGHSDGAGPGLFRPEAPRDAAAPRQHEQNHPGHGLHRGLFVRHRGVYGLVQRQCVRAVRRHATGRWARMPGPTGG